MKNNVSRYDNNSLLYVLNTLKHITHTILKQHYIAHIFILLHSIFQNEK
jgi:hypothetical protein